MMVLPRSVILFFMKPTFKANPVCLFLRFWQCGACHEGCKKSFTVPLDRYSIACVILNPSISSVIACDAGL
jgi:hypothetical protein